MSQPDRILDRAKRRERVPYSDMHILRLEKEGKFPKRIQLGPNRVGWLDSEIDQWIEERVAERDAELVVAQEYDLNTLDSDDTLEDNEEDEAAEEISA